MTDGEWFAETGAGTFTISYRYTQRIYSGRSAFQQVDILDTVEYGRMLFLDGVAQSAERDEFIYHEGLVHPAMLTHPRPETVCVIGGAEGATVREALRHPAVKRVVMVDIDGQVVDLCRRYLPDWSAGALDDPRVELHIGDGRAYLEQTDERFDVILVDLSDPVRDGPAVFLFTQEFYRIVADRLTSDGVCCCQGESLQPWRVELHARMVNTLNTVFPVVAAYPYSLPSFHEMHAFVLASKKVDPRSVDLGACMADRGLSFRYFTANHLNRLFTVPGYVEMAYARYPEPLTDAQPVRL